MLPPITFGRVVAGLIAVTAMLTLAGWQSGSLPLSSEVCYQAESGEEEECIKYWLPIGVVIWVTDRLNHNEGAILGLATIALAWFTYSLRRSTDRLWDAGERQLDVANKTADAAKEANELTTKLFAAEQRPWISVSTITVTKPVRLEASGCFTLSLKFVLLNTGRVPARSVWSYAKSHNLMAGPYDFGTELVSLVRKVLSAPTMVGFMLFPDETKEYDTEISVNPNGSAGEKPDSIWPLVFGFIDYTSALDGSRRQTGFGFKILRVDREDAIPLIEILGITPNQLRTKTDFLVGQFAT